MDTQRTSSVQLVNGFPSVAPPIQMARLDEPAPDVQCNELRWWFIAPEAGQSRRWATYNALGHELIDIYDLEVLGRTRVHEEECFEIRHRYWGREGKIEREGFAYGDLRDGVTQWFGARNLSAERRV